MFECEHKTPFFRFETIAHSFISQETGPACFAY